MPDETPALPKAPRAVVFIDGNNVYHGLTKSGVRGPAALSYTKIAEKMVASTEKLEAIRYYVGQVENTSDTSLYNEQRKFVARQRGLDKRITFHFGRLEQRPVDNTLARAIQRWITEAKPIIRYEYTNHIRRLCEQYERLPCYVEKAVDVALALDVTIMAQRDEYDSAYIFSADGDYTPAINFAKARAKRVCVRSVSPASQLKNAVGLANYQQLDAEWFKNCYIDS